MYHWPDEFDNPVKDILVHLINNSIDHGFILPLDSGQKVNNPYFKIHAHQEKNQIKIEVTDNGAGLNKETIVQRAKEKGVYNDSDDYTEFLFKDGFSSSHEATLTSGRGVGMSAIRDIVTKFGGHVNISNNPGKPGARVSITLKSKRSLVDSA